jgi:UDP-N-acetylglucosamine--N-acetylmuramyl-(pentapeptide) pyrophosphoryl-undecaprenol N-acetylglucosamine transferase
VYPALSVLQALSGAVEPQRNLVEVQWVGGEQGMEVDLVKRAGIPYQSIPAAGVHGVGVRALPGNLVQLARGLARSRRMLRRYQPQVLLFTGGYVAIPMALAARFTELKGRPRSLVYVPDIEPGWALKALVRMADHVALTAPASQAYIPKRTPSTVTGYPLRQELIGWQRQDALRKLNLQSDLPVFLVVGGSRGARSINQALFAALTELLPSMQVVHASGQLDWPAAQQRRSTLPEYLIERYHPYPYLHEEIGAAFAAADLVLSRAGASTLGEYPYFGLPALLVPYPYAWRYQRVNADFLADQRAAQVIEDAELKRQLLPTVKSLMADTGRRKEMAQAMRSLAQPEASRRIAEILLGLSRE